MFILEAENIILNVLEAFKTRGFGAGRIVGNGPLEEAQPVQTS